MLFVDKLIEAIKKKNNPSVVGLDPKIEYVPDFIKFPIYKEYGHTLGAASRAILDYNKLIIDSVYDIVPAVKPQIAYYEMYGTEGIKTFYDTVEYARSKDLIVIGDCKRNDIGSTAECYAKAFLGSTKVEETYWKAFDLDAVTVNPYLGDDGIIPFFNECFDSEKGMFVLVKTSNPSSSQFQDIKTENGETIFEIVAKSVDCYAKKTIGEYGYSNVGAVVGATYPAQAMKLRKIMQNSYFLVPGYGMQGGKAKDIAHFFNTDGLGAIISSSRGIMLAYQGDGTIENINEEEFIKKTRNAAIMMKQDIVNALNQAFY